MAIRLTTDLPAETLKTRRECQDIRKWMKQGKKKKQKNPTTKLSLPSEDLIQSDGEIKNFIDNQQVRELSTTKPALQQMLKELL